MHTKATPNRHGVLFEMLRHQNLSDRTAQRVQKMDQSDEAGRHADLFLHNALQSWQPAHTTPAHIAKSAAKPRRNNEFFRTVGA